MSDARVVPDPFTRGAFRVVTGATSQSWVDPGDPLRLDFEYVQRIAELLRLTVLTRPAGERVRIVHLGGGGLTLPRFVAAVRPHTAQIVCEPDAGLVAEVRRKIPLPRRSGIKIREIDGRSGLAAMPPDHADVVIVDAFNGHRVPGDLATREFFGDVRQRLRRGGLVVMNLADQAPFDWGRRCVAGMADTFRHLLLTAEPAVFKGRRFGNLVLAASSAPLPVEELQRRNAAAPFPYRTVAGREVQRWCSGAHPFEDAAPVDSPGPLSGKTWFD
jgi:spermidine synthase